MPWLTARENVAIGADRVYPRATRAERQEVVEYYLEKVGLADAMDRLAADMSNGMRQRVGIARAFALSPKLLLLDEPFGMLDSLTRWELQEVLMEVWSQTRVTAICVTHDVDEAILLSDRVVMMTNGPEATIGKHRRASTCPARAPARRWSSTPTTTATAPPCSSSSRRMSTAPSPRRKSPDGLRHAEAESSSSSAPAWPRAAPSSTCSRPTPTAYEVTLFNAEPRGNYNRLMLSPVLSGEKTYDEIVTHDDDWYAANNVETRFGEAVTRIDRARRVVVTKAGETPYDKLLIATGSAPFILPLPGKDLEGRHRLPRHRRRRAGCSTPRRCRRPGPW